MTDINVANSTNDMINDVILTLNFCTETATISSKGTPNFSNY